MLPPRLRSAAAILLAVVALAACDAAQDDDAAVDSGEPVDDGESVDDDDAAESGDADASSNAAASDDGSVTVGADLVDQPDAEVEMRMFDFEPAEVEIAAGETVEFRNTDKTLHTVTSDDGVFDEELDGRGELVQITFEEPGTYNYQCRPHDFMTGTITVTE